MNPLLLQGEAGLMVAWGDADLETGIVEDVFPELGRGQLLRLVPGGLHHWVWSEHDPDLDRSSLLVTTLQR